ncbi:endonuclease/exonuclease/phosphatase family protein [Pseudomonas sp. MBLB4136]|uniref:endonuclease/exonuclease/phosphatase family protein n=1 Tax=Pseudomonas sp. MBLB4136 TaxID=3451558 RepID=UPI003F75045B
MRIVSWNCNGAFRKKLHLLEELNADVLVIQECEDPVQCRDAHYKQWANNHLWAGDNKNKGLGVFAKPDVRLEPLNLDSGRLQLFLPLMVDDITLLAVWTKEAGSPTFKYIGQLYKWLQSHKAHLATPKAVVIGDLNSNACWDVWDRWWNHSDVVKELESLGLHSLYHSQAGESQGAETQPTFFLHRKLEKPYHIDYAFLSEMLKIGARISIGAAEHWLEHSDHLPLIVDIVSGINK